MVVWTNRGFVDATMPGVAATDLGYDPDTGQYLHQGRPFTGVGKAYARGQLRSVTQYVDGVAEGVSVSWFPGGQLEQYAEVRGGVFHGARTVWDEAGNVVARETFRDGEPA